MKGCGKLFKRDRIYLLGMAAAVVLMLLYVMAGCYRSFEFTRMQREGYDIYISQYHESADMLLRLWGDTDLGNLYKNGMRAVFFIVAAAQIARWHILEGKRGKEFKKLLPVKGKSFITYDLIQGILFVWIPVIVSLPFVNGWIEGSVDNIDYQIWTFHKICSLFIVNTFIYVLLVFSKAITNHIPGAVFTAFIICFGFFCIQSYTGRIAFFAEELPVESAGAMILAAVTVIFVILSYLCDSKKDIAGSGVFSFKTAHYFILGAIFVELVLVLAGSLGSTLLGNKAGTAGGILLAGAVCLGLHYVMRPKRL